MDSKEAGSMGGKKRWEGRSQKERSDHARRMVQAREKKKKTLPGSNK